ncbi:TPR and ankyrin repeat-containing protein 1-like [Glandiceps talaboti]
MTINRGESLYHVVVRARNVGPQNIETALRILISYKVNPCVINSEGKLAADYIGKSSPVAKILRKAMDEQQYAKSVQAAVVPTSTVQAEAQTQQNPKGRAAQHKMKATATMTASTRTKTATSSSSSEKPVQKQDKPKGGHMYRDRPSFHEAVGYKEMCQWENALKSFGKIIEDCHDDDFMANDLKRSKRHVLSVLQYITKVSPKVECQTPTHIWNEEVSNLAKKGDWKLVYILLKGGGNGYSFGEGGLAKGCDCQRISIQDYLTSGHSDPNVKKYDMVKALLQNGAKADGVDGSTVTMKPIAYALRLLEDGRLVTLLLQHGADPVSLSLDKGDTPLHAALIFALKKKDLMFEILKVLCEKYKRHPKGYPNLNPCVQDSEGNTLFHIVIQGQCNHILLVAVKILVEYRVDPQIKNNQGKIPLNSLKKDDRRLPYLKMAADHYPAVYSKSKKGKDKVKNKKEEDENKNGKVTEKMEEVLKSESHVKLATGVLERFPKDEIKKRILSAIEDLEQFIPKRPRLEPILELDGANLKARHSQADTKTGLARISEEDQRQLSQETQDEDIPEANKQAPEHTVGVEENNDDILEKQHEQGNTEYDSSLFDDMEWEVECTSAVWKILKDKRLQHKIKVSIINKIRHLANGNWRPDLSKRLEGVAKQQDIKLFEAKLTKAARILWELAIAFSPRCSENPERRLQTTEQLGAVGGRIYSEVIRVWDIVFDHDNVSRSIDNIVKSHQRGQHCIIKKNLKGIDKKEFPKDRATIQRVPMFYREIANVKQEPAIVKKKPPRQDTPKLFFPPASSNEAEYHIMKFYSFSSTLVNNILLNKDVKVDFPFRVTELEHAIIHLNPDPPSAILLLGRSGTGKTTCCLYRLWSSFIRYWDQAAKSGEPWIPRDVAFVHEDDSHHDQDEDDHNEKDCDDESTDAASSLTCAYTVTSSCACPTVKGDEEGGEKANVEGTPMDHLHQIFITKNAVLCSEVQKNFRELSHASEAANDHVEVENNPVPYRLQDAHQAQYPLFLNSRQWLLILDASLPDPYFPRKDDGSLKKQVKGWGTENGPLLFIPILEEDDEDDGVYEDHDAKNDEGEEIGEDPLNIDAQADEEGQRREMDLRKEVTYEVFAYELWSKKVNKGIKVDYHPTLVWMEINSFIQGSIEALHSDHGYLSLEQYQELGKKRAPNFTADRCEIYKLFEKYKRIKSQHGLFDECDLVFNIYNRLKKVQAHAPEWCIHQFYVDETQDFTQAELSLIIRCCSDPNALFLTGDTAQSIMRGVAFRFEDLKTLFHYARKSMKAVGKTARVTVPKRVYQLTHNYRSHAGIMNLATSVVDLMIEFFPESFDRLQKDQGLFDGPQPVLLESCSFSDLALLLRGNKRKTSEIEFGAHQVILVANEEAKDALPEELKLGLVLTIYESKGLEFDDVLLYNFFKDSPANKEWRIVTSYLEKLMEDFLDNHNGCTDGNLVELDIEDTEHAGKRPRSLDFDPNKHKVLNSELKYLYTAVTRARVNVWIFDEEPDKRAPMFEYFRKRKLVQVVRLEKNDSLSDGMFASTSTAVEWNKRGDYFYNNKLWQVAAKCYRKGGDVKKEKMSLAQHRALQAERLRENPRKLREEFLAAADEFLQCDMPQPAARCLYNAKEYELSAQLFEKLGKFTNAALLNEKRLKKTLDAARCYDQASNYKKAVELFCSVNAFDKATDVVERYNIRKSEYEDSHSPLPPDLVRDAPGVLNTIERLSYRAAEMHFHSHNFGKMLEAITRFPSLEAQRTFLMNKNRIEDAAQILKTSGRLLEAAKLMRSRGKLKEALECADPKDDSSFRAEVLLAYSRVHVQGHENDEDHQNVLGYLEEAIALFRDSGNLPGQAEATMIAAGMRKDKHLLHEAILLFYKDNNITGQIECVDILMTNWPVTRDVIQSTALTILEMLLKLISVLFKPVEIHEKHMAAQCDNFYGLKEAAGNMREVLVNEGARFLKMDQGHCDVDPDTKQVRLNQVRTRIIKYLFGVASEWVNSMRSTLTNDQEQLCQCPNYVIGVACTVKGKCPHLHNMYTRYSYLNYLQAIVAEIMLNDVLFNASKKLPHMDTMRKDIEQLSPSDEEADKLCVLLSEALLPKHFHQRISSENPSVVESVLKIVQRISVMNQLQNVAERRWQSATVKDKRSNTDMYLLIWKFHLLAKVDPSVFKEWLNMVQGDYSKEVIHVKKLLYPEKIPPDIGLISFGSRGRVSFFSLMHPFFESAQYLHDRNNPVQSVGSFNRFIGLPAKRALPPLIPSIANVLMLMELKYTLCMAIFAKCNGVSVVVPASYYAQVNFFDRLCAAKRGHQHYMFASVNMAKINAGELKQLGGHVRFLVNLLCGEHYDGYFNILKDAFSQNSDESIKSGEAERSLVMALVMLSNIGVVTPVICEPTLRKHLTAIRVDKKLPDRVAEALKSVQQAKGIHDVVSALKKLLIDRENEYLHQCRWRWDTRHGGIRGLEYRPIQEDRFYNRFNRGLPPGVVTPVYDDTASTFAAPIEVVDEEQTKEEEEAVEYDLEGTGMSAEEFERARQEQASHDHKHACVNAANTISRSFRKYRLRRNLTILVVKIRYGLLMESDIADEPCDVEESQPTGPLAEFSSINQRWCGICGMWLASAEATQESSNQYGQIDLKLDEDHDESMPHEPWSPVGSPQGNLPSSASPTSPTALFSGPRLVGASFQSETCVPSAASPAATPIGMSNEQRLISDGETNQSEMSLLSAVSHATPIEMIGGPRCVGDGDYKSESSLHSPLSPTLPFGLSNGPGLGDVNTGQSEMSSLSPVSSASVGPSSELRQGVDGDTLQSGISVPGLSAAPMPGPWGDVIVKQIDQSKLEEKCSLQTYKVHIANLGHWERSRLFRLYEKKYVESIYPAIDGCESFLADLDEDETSVKTVISAQLSLDIQQLRDIKVKLDECIRYVHNKRIWENTEVARLAEDLQTDLSKLQKLVLEIKTNEGSKLNTAKVIQDTADEEVVLAADDGTLEDEVHHLLPVLEKPNTKPKRKKKGRRGRKI